MKRVLVTGGDGFIGSHLCERLLARGDEVLCVDNFFISRRQNVSHLVGNPQFEFMRHDITWPLYVEVDRIFNLACPASPVHYQFDPVQTTKTSVHGAINMLGFAKRLKVRILQSSTSEVYGDPAQQHPQMESYWGNVNRSVRGPATTRGSGARRPSSSIIIASTTCRSASCASSTRTARGCTPTTAAWCRTSSSRR
jgi:UDP-glucuronate decarboxylase